MFKALQTIIIISFSHCLLSQNDLVSLNERLADARDSNNFVELARTYLQIGDFQAEKERNHELAFENYTRSLEHFKFIQDSVNYYKVQHRIANVFRLTEQFTEAEERYNQVIAYRQKVNDTKGLASVLLDNAILFGNDNDLENQGRYLNRIAKMNRELNDSVFYINYVFEKIRYLETLQEIDSAKMLSKQVFRWSQDLNHDYFLGKSLYFLGYYNNKERNYEDAIRYLNNSLLFIGKNALEPLKLDIYKLLASCYQTVGDYKKAYRFVSDYSSLNDSILHRQRIIAINNLTFKHKVRQKNRDLKLMEQDKEIAVERNAQQRRLLYVFGFGLALLATAIYFIVQFFRQRIQATRIINQQRDKIDKQRIKDLENDVKIRSMQSVIVGQEEERERIAKDLHDSLGGLLSAVKLQFEKVRTTQGRVFNLPEFENGQNLLDTAVEEVRTISRNLQPSSLKNMGLVAAINDLINRYVGETYPEIHFQHYNISKGLDTMVATSIYRIIQELLNNAIKYAKAKEIIIQLNQEDDEVVISFEDDGIGFDPKTVEKGMGLENIQSRVTYLKGDLQIESQKDIGTSYHIHVKVNEV